MAIVEVSHLGQDILQAVGSGVIIGSLVGLSRKLVSYHERKAREVHRQTVRAALTPEEHRILRGAVDLNEVMPNKIPHWQAQKSALDHVLWRRERIAGIPDNQNERQANRQ